MKLEDLKDDAERIDFLLHALDYVTGCETCLKDPLYEGKEGYAGPCPHLENRRRGIYGSNTRKLCPDLDFNDCRPIGGITGDRAEA
ncbi:hypothetical protein SAMN04488503_2212 [Humidesulfovibrio mexicanus]|uniref:Uncharacterized protein n=1 Tax=Humidesulfovibrio mexicanus TaxID=147047 RepID=A0A239AUB7_9BACT|nr:hypothetical protein [Humidesulfovibrio mexicanus]SNR98941.1 hypothetical protein SAMN04488503_2212 [Humidesulfovibrio mexicanus]